MNAQDMAGSRATARWLAAAVVLVVVFGFCGEASAQSLYLVTGPSSTLYEVNIVDASTALATEIMEFSGNFRAIALAAGGQILVGVERTAQGLPSKVVAVDLSAEPPLVQVELCTLPAPFGGEVEQLAYDPAGALWATNQATNHLFSIDVSPGPGNDCNVNDRGAIQGAISIGGDIAFDESGTLFMMTDCSLLICGTPQLYTVNPTTAVATHVGSSPAISPNPGMAFTADGQLLVTEHDNMFMFFVDKTNGGGTGGPMLIDTATNFPLFIAGGDLASSVASAAIPAELDLTPGESNNEINLHSNGKTQVAICTTDALDAATINPATVLVAGAPVAVKPNGSLMASLSNVCGDSRPDLVVEVQTQDMQLSSGDTQVTVTGQTFGGESFVGTAPVQVIP